MLGQVLHIAQVTRMELAFSCTCLGSFNFALNKAAFQGIKRIGRYLMTRLHMPIFYPRHKLTMYQTIHFEAEPGKWLEHVVSNLMQLLVDLDHARDLKTRKSMSCILTAICSLTVHWHMGKQSCITTPSTDAETGPTSLLAR